MSHTINVTLNERSLGDAVTILASYRANRLVPAILRAMDALAQEAADILRQAYQGVAAPYLTNYDPSISVNVREGNDSGKIWAEISAQGEQVGFLEFGTGALSDEMHPLAEQAPFPVFSGSWSNSPDGAGTWLKWLESGKDPMEYPYNREPRYGIYAAVEYIKAHAAEYVADELRRISL